MPSPFPTQAPPPYPALHLYPLNDHTLNFQPKQISLAGGQHCRIGRQTNLKTVPGERNGYFDSKVLSRQHAEVWEENGKIYIKDVKSSNGTFINGERMSAEGVESDPFELKTDDIVEFGIDIVGEDNKTIIHHKVAARAACIITAEDAVIASREHFAYAANAAQQQQVAQQQQQQQQQAAQRRPALQAPGQHGSNLGLGALAPTGRPGKSGLTFDLILSRLQSELQKSRETGAELHSLTGAMTDIHDTLGGTVPPPAPPYPHTLPPVRAPDPPPPPPAQPASPPKATADPDAIVALQSQLHDTQASLASHVEKIRVLESLLAEHESMKQEVGTLREMMEERKREMALFIASSSHSSTHDTATIGRSTGLQLHSVEEEDDDDARSVSTIVPDPAPGSAVEDEEDAEEDEEERRRRTREMGRPRTPEPGLRRQLMMEEEEEVVHDPEMLQPPASSASNPASGTTPSPAPAPSPSDAELSARLEALTTQLDTALALSRTLAEQQTAAQSTIAHLEAKVGALEAMLAESKKERESDREDSRKEREEQRKERDESKKEREEAKRERDDGKREREEWNRERERMSAAREEWEARMKKLEDGFRDFQVIAQANGHSHHRVVEPITPPSPRSISSDSGRRRRKSRGRYPSPSPSRVSSHGDEGRERSGSASTSDGQEIVVEDFARSPEKVNQLPGKIPSPPSTAPGSINGHANGSAVVSHSPTPVKLGDIPTPYLGAAASVVIIGMAAWAVAARAKE